MKIAAICYSGQIRNFQECFPSHIKHIIRSNPDYQFLIFGHFWNDASLYGELYRKDILSCGQWGMHNIKAFLEINPDGFALEKPITFKTSLKPDPRWWPHPINNALSMFYSIKKCYQQACSYAELRNIQFDVIIRSRTDLFFNKDLKFNEFDLNGVWLNEQFINMHYGVNDLFSFGIPDQMKFYFNTFDRISEIVEKGCAIGSECLLGFNLADQSANLKKTKLQHLYYEVYRDI